MAYIVAGSRTTDSTTSSSANWAPSSLPTGLSQNDIVFGFVAQRNASSVLSCATSGWNLVGTRGSNPSYAAYGQFFYAVCGVAGAYNAPTFSSTVSTGWSCVMFAIRDADTSSTIDQTLQTNWGGTATPSAGTPTSTTNGCLVLHGWCGSAALTMRQDIDAAHIVETQTTNNPTVLVTYRQQQTAGATDACQCYVNSASNGGSQWTICITNKSGGALSPDVRTTSDLVQWYGAIDATAPTWYGLNQTSHTFAGGISTLDGINVTTAAPTVLTSATTLSGLGTSTSIATSTTNNQWDGAWHAVTLDLQGKVFSVEVATSRDGTIAGGRIGVGGFLIGFSDGTNYAIYRVKNTYKGWKLGQTFRVFVCPETTTAQYSSGSVSWGAVTQISYWLHHLNTSADTFSVQNAFAVTQSAITGGGSSYPMSSRDLYTATAFDRITGFALLQSSAQVRSNFSLVIGDGTNSTYFDASVTSTEFPQEWTNTSVANWNDEWNVSSSSVSVNFKPKSGDTVYAKAAIFATDTRQDLTLDATFSTGAAKSFSGTSIVGYDVTWNSDISCTGTTFSGCYDVDLKGADFTNCTFTKPNGSECFQITADGSVITGCETDVVGTSIESSGYHIVLGTSVTAVELANHTFTGTAGTDKVHVLKTSGTVTITISGTTSLVVGDVTSAGATVVVAAPELYQSVTISGLTSGSRVQIYDTTAATELANSTQASPGSNVTWTSATAMTWTDPVAAAADRTIRVRIAYVNGASAKGFIEASIGTCGTIDGTESVSYLANQVDDAVYNANGIDGPSIYATSGITFTDSGSNDRINCNIGGGAVSWGTIYACFAYWMSTSTGIADDIAYVTAVDPANYLLDSLKIKNTSATPLTITGGWGRDATSLTIADCIDTAGSTGNIFPQPDHVVAYATGSGSLTAGDITNIWSNGSRTLTTTIPSASDNANAVANVAVDGSITMAESLRLQNSILGGKLSGVVTGTETFRSLADDKDRVTVTVDSVGNRSAVVRDLT